MLVTVSFGSSFSLIAVSRSSTKRYSGAAECHSAFWVRHVPDLARGTQGHFRRESGCGEPRKLVRSHLRDSQLTQSLLRRCPSVRDERSTPGSSSSAKLGDLAAGSSCRARTAPRYGEALVVVSSRNQNPDFASTGPRYGTFARLGLKACVCVPCRARIETSGPGWSRGSRQRIVGPCLVEFDAKIMISHHF